ncbi:MAG: hypothetical protein QNJ85_06195 [Gammaproteobacteria bacterium]|nr:hypothetical protein [Gammaproteobacteria bacterium]
MSRENMTTECSIFDYADQENGSRVADATNISWRMKQDRQTLERKEELRRQLVREQHQRKSRQSTPSPSILRKFLRLS